MFIEIWKDIIGFEGYYQISNLGNVRSLDRYIKNKNGTCQFRKGKSKILKNSTDGYSLVTLSKNGKDKTIGVHILVAKHFIDNPNDLPEVNHKDFNRKNNIVSNLEWCTHQYNVLYSRINGHYDHIYKSGKDNPNYGNHKLSEYYKNNPMIAKEKASRPGAQNGRAKSIILYDKNMCKIKQFSYIGECANYLIKNKLSKGKVDSVRSNISIAIKKHKLYLNYYYEYA